MTKLTTWFGTIRKAWALAVSATSLWAGALLTDGQPGVNGKAWAALIAIWTNVVIVYLVGNDTPGIELEAHAGTIERISPALVARPDDLGGQGVGR